MPSDRVLRVFAEMKSLERVEVPQNGVKKDGMVALFAGLRENPQL